MLEESIEPLITVDQIDAEGNLVFPDDLLYFQQDGVPPYISCGLKVFKR